VVATLGVTMAIGRLISLVPVFERTRPIFEAHPEVDSSKASPGALSGAIELEHVTFRYDAEGPLVTDDVTFQVKAGEYIALVGPSGSGKSSIMRLLLGFELPESGAISFDSCDLATLDVEAVRRQIGVVLQSARLTPGSVYSNIAGSFGISAEDAWEAAERAGLADDIRAMPMGMETIVSEGGGTFSGGQKQRLIIARALAAKPKVLLFDEATSALDNATQQTVTDSLGQIDVTRIVIAHRLSTIVGADRIVVLDRGKVIQIGSYADLILEPGLFAELAARQIV
jgi:ABC-type bacteriocin/lantibiotic exporter with double-glycine peptidase domain